MVGRRLGRPGQHCDTKRRRYDFRSCRLSDRTLNNIRRGAIPNSLGDQGPEAIAASKDLAFRSSPFSQSSFSRGRVLALTFRRENDNPYTSSRLETACVGPA